MAVNFFFNYLLALTAGLQAFSFFYIYNTDKDSACYIDYTFEFQDSSELGE